MSQAVPAAGFRGDDRSGRFGENLTYALKRTRIYFIRDRITYLVFIDQVLEQAPNNVPDHIRPEVNAGGCNQPILQVTLSRDQSEDAVK